MISIAKHYILSSEWGCADLAGNIVYYYDIFTLVRWLKPRHLVTTLFFLRLSLVSEIDVELLIHSRLSAQSLCVEESSFIQFSFYAVL